MKSATDSVKAALRKKRPDKKALAAADFLSTGSTLLNLACSGRTLGGFAKGKYYFLVGDSTSGKTFLSLTCMAEAGINGNFSDYRMIYDNPEDGALMDIRKFFGPAVEERLEPPRGTREDPIYSDVIEDFYYNLDDACKDGRPFLYVLDSMDSLSSKAEQSKFDEQKKAHRKQKEAAGSFGDGKAAKNSQMLRKVLPKLRKSGSILIIISQTRDNLGQFVMDKKTRSGGRALKFYATLEMWSAVKQKLKKTVNGKPRQIGMICQVKIKKNRITGKDRTIEIPIYHSTGFDDTGSCVDFLLAEKHWKASNGEINAKELEFKGSRERLIKHVESESLERDLRVLVGKVWRGIEDACEVQRKSRYS